jgi:hypothetical protein
MKKILLFALLVIAVTARAQSSSFKELEKNIRSKIFARDTALCNSEKISTINLYPNGLVAIKSTNLNQDRPDFFNMLKLVTDLIPEANGQGFYREDSTLIFCTSVDTVTSGEYGKIDYKIEYRVQLTMINIHDSETAKALEADFIRLRKICLEGEKKTAGR